MADATSSSPPGKQSTCTIWMRSFTALEVLLSCVFTMTTLAFLVAVVARSMMPMAGCGDPCFREPPDGYEPVLSRRMDRVPEFDREVVVSSRAGLPTAAWEPNMPRDIRGGEFPYLGSINVDDKVACMTIIVTDRWCLTTASCFKAIHPGKTYVIMERNATGHLFGNYQAEKVMVHQSYKQGTATNDMVAIKSADPFKLDPKFYLKLPTRRNELKMATGDLIIIMGWGNTMSKENDEEKINCWPILLTSDRRLNTSAEVYEKAGVFAHGPGILFVISRNKRTVKLSEHREWVESIETY